MLYSETIGFTDPYPYQRSIRAADLQVLPTAKGPFRAELKKIVLGKLWAQQAREDSPRVWAGTFGHGRAVIGFLSDAGQPALQHCGMELPHGAIIVSNARSIHQRSEAGCRWSSMSLTPTDLDAAARMIVGRELTVPSVTHLVRPESALMSRLLSLHQAAANLANTSPEILVLPEVARALEHDLIHVMVRCLTEGAPISISGGQHHHSTIMADFENFLSENLLRPIYLADICSATGASERVLRICCQEHLGMGPVRYLWLRRMHLARRALIQSPGKTVTQIATDHGFWELGRFATEYHALFDEPPSATRRRNATASTNFTKRSN
jgi:AraC-like DNA-binding protein